MDGDRFTRENWRQGGRSRLRKRTKPWGGQKTAPVEFLAAAKIAGFKPGRPGYRLCARGQAQWRPMPTIGYERLSGMRELMEAFSRWPGRGSFSEAVEPRRSRRGPRPSKADRRQRRSN